MPDRWLARDPGPSPTIPYADARIEGTSERSRRRRVEHDFDVTLSRVR
jgi:hypothetical protein